jgi:hypothetical protein
VAKMVALIGFLVVLITLQSPLLNAELTKLQHLPKKKGNLAILVIGDFGRKGTYNQSDVATQVFEISSSVFNYYVFMIIYALHAYYFDNYSKLVEEHVPFSFIIEIGTSSLASFQKLKTKIDWRCMDSYRLQISVFIAR